MSVEGVWIKAAISQCKYVSDIFFSSDCYWDPEMGSNKAQIQTQIVTVLYVSIYFSGNFLFYETNIGHFYSL